MVELVIDHKTETDIFIWGYLKIIPRTPGPNTKDKVEDIW